MTTPTHPAQILAAKEAKGLTWEQIAEHVDMSPVWTCSACMGMNSMPEEQASAVANFLGLNSDVASELQKCPNKKWDQVVPTDPMIYRLYEIMGVYGETLKALTHEKFGDGIMSAIDFSLHVDKEENPKGDRVVITMNGKFLKYASW